MKHPNVTIQIGNKDDVDDIHLLLAALAKETGFQDKMISTPTNLIKFGFSSTPLFETLLAKHNNNTVGLCLYFFTFSSWLGSPGIYIQDLFVEEKYRKFGIGEQLLIKTAQLNEAKEITHIRLTVDENNKKAQDFYRKIGFQYQSKERTLHIKKEKLIKLTGKIS